MQYKVKAVPLDWVDAVGNLHCRAYAVFKRKYFWNEWEFCPHNWIKEYKGSESYFFPDGTFTNYDAALNYAKELNSIN